MEDVIAHFNQDFAISIALLQPSWSRRKTLAPQMIEEEIIGTLNGLTKDLMFR